jgi:hypothetical protein
MIAGVACGGGSEVMTWRYVSTTGRTFVGYSNEWAREAAWDSAARDLACPRAQIELQLLGGRSIEYVATGCGERLVYHFVERERLGYELVVVSHFRWPLVRGEPAAGSATPARAQ